MNAPEGRKFYGSVTIGERGQIVIPVDARKDFGMKPGDKLLVFGDMERGLGIATLDIMQKTMEGTTDLFREVVRQMEDTSRKSPTRKENAGK